MQNEETLKGLLYLKNTGTRRVNNALAGYIQRAHLYWIVQPTEVKWQKQQAAQVSHQRAPLLLEGNG